MQMLCNSSDSILVSKKLSLKMMIPLVLDEAKISKMGACIRRSREVRIEGKKWQKKGSIKDLNIRKQSPKRIVKDVEFGLEVKTNDK